MAAEIGVSELCINQTSRNSMAGAVQVLALSDDEDNLSCAWNTLRSQTQTRSRPGIRQCTPITPGTLKFCVLRKWLFLLFLHTCVSDPLLAQ